VIRRAIVQSSGRVLLVLAMLGVIGCDRVTKRMAVESLAGAPARSFLSDTIRLDYAENPGGFLSMGAGLPSGARTAIFTLGTAMLLLSASALAVWLRWKGGAALGLSLVVAGGASNWIDRVLHGRVVDFLNVGIGPVRTGIFNVADVAIVAGAVIVLLAEVVRTRSPSA
jgi:signal peptidase II